MTAAPTRKRARRSGVERLAFWTLLALWSVLFGASLRDLVQPASYPSVFVSSAPAPDAYPAVRGFRRFLAGEETDLREGDRVVRVGATDLRGANALDFFVAFVDQIGAAPEVAVEYERGELRGQTSAPGGSTRLVVAAQLPGSLAFALAAVVLWLRAVPTPMSRAFIAWFLTVAIYQAAHFLGSPPATYTVYATHLVAMALLGPLALRAVLLFPDGKEPPGGMPRWPWLFAALTLPHTGHFGWPVPAHIGIPVAAVGFAVLLVTLLVIVTRRYRRQDVIGRRRLKWFYLGLYLAAMPPILGAVLSAAAPGLAPYYFLSFASVAFIPLSLLISIVRFNLFDVDRLISTAASYNLLLAVAIAVGATVVPVTAEAAAELFGVDRWVSRFAMAVPMALLVLSANAWLRPRIERAFFAERYALDLGVQELVGTLSSCATTESLIRRSGDGLYRLFRPEACAVYSRAGTRFEPLYAEGSTVPASFEAEGPLLATLRQRRAPLALDATGFGDPIELTPFDRAVLETLDAAVVVPIWHRGELKTLVCLGPRRSGDVYTPTDLRLLASVADRVEVQMETFDRAEVLVQSQRMQEALRRYVPGAVADAIEAGRGLEPREQEITVLFVDLRGYTSYCEALEPEQIFATVTGYTEKVSAILARFGGTLVEFNGDGMMAMFGAPAVLAAKESSAVRAANEIAAGVASLPPTVAGGAELSVGVGISTGVAFVGNIRSHDRQIWTAVGNTVNLAARLQALTRELHALVAIDRRTYEAAGSAAAGFQRLDNVPIRGRTAGEDVFMLPRG